MSEFSRDEALVLPVVAWMTDDGRVATEETKRTGMANASKENFNEPLCRMVDAIAAINAYKDALMVTPPATPTTRVERARRLYEQHPTYRGTQPIPWKDAPQEVRREWLDKAKVARPVPEVITGWPPSMLQDDSRELSKWLAETPNALQHVKAARAAYSPPIPLGTTVQFQGEKFKVVCKGDVPGTFDLHVYPKTRSGDQWRNVPATKLTIITP